MLKRPTPSIVPTLNKPKMELKFFGLGVEELLDEVDFSKKLR
jgi:hypothetical protein